MEKMGISLALILFGVAFCTLALSQVNSMIVSGAQSELARPVAEAQIVASEQLAKSYGQTDSEIAATSKQARDLLNNTISTMNDSYWKTAAVDAFVGLILLFAGLMVYPKHH